MTATEKLQNFVDFWGLGISKEKLIGKLYSHMRAGGYENVYITNGRYLTVNGTNYQLIKSIKTDRWIVKTF